MELEKAERIRERSRTVKKDRLGASLKTIEFMSGELNEALEDYGTTMNEVMDKLNNNATKLGSGFTNLIVKSSWMFDVQPRLAATALVAMADFVEACQKNYTEGNAVLRGGLIDDDGSDDTGIEPMESDWYDLGPLI